VFDVSVVIPALREQANLRRLLPQLFNAFQLAGFVAEVIVVDDESRDGTEELCTGLASTYALRLITRRNERGLASAVLYGLREASGDVCVVMDADLSHPPEVVPSLVQAARSPACDLALGSRYIAGGSVEPSWGWFRRLNSRVATLLARGLTDACDPMAGFFAIKRSTLSRAKVLRPVGYKIALELIVRCDCRHVVEVPIAFKNRKHGNSKLSIAQQWAYIRHLARLYAARYFARHNRCDLSSIDAMKSVPSSRGAA
jgi:dolichol-phosphate mannosyltransferase